MHEQFRKGWDSALNAVERFIIEQEFDPSLAIQCCRYFIKELDDGDMEIVGEPEALAKGYRYRGRVYEITDYGLVPSQKTLQELTED